MRLRDKTKNKYMQRITNVRREWRVARRTSRLVVLLHFAFLCIAYTVFERYEMLPPFPPFLFFLSFSPRPSLVCAHHRAWNTLPPSISIHLSPLAGLVSRGETQRLR